MTRRYIRILSPAIESPWSSYFSDVVGAAQTTARRRPRSQASRPRNLADRAARAPSPGLRRAHQPALRRPSDAAGRSGGVGAFPAAGPYYIAEYRPAERIVLPRNRFYGGKRPHHVDGFTVDLRASSFDEVLDRIERGAADWGFAHAPAYLDPARRLVAKYGVNRSQFFVRPGLFFRGFALNTSRPLFTSACTRRGAGGY